MATVLPRPAVGTRRPVPSPFGLGAPATATRGAPTAPPTTAPPPGRYGDWDQKRPADTREDKGGSPHIPGFGPGGHLGPPPGFGSWREHGDARRAEEIRRADEWRQRLEAEGQLPPGAVPLGDPRAQAGGGPGGQSNAYYQPTIMGPDGRPTKAPYYVLRTNLGPGALGLSRPRTPEELMKVQAEEKAAGINPAREHYGAKYNVDLWRQYLQQHPNATGFLGIAGLPEEVRKNWLAAKAHEYWQRASVNAANTPGGLGPHPAGGLARTTGLPPSTAQRWMDMALKYYADQERQYLAKAPPVYGPPTAPAKSPIGATQQTALQQDLAGRKGAAPGSSFTKDGRTYKMNKNGAWVDVTDPNARVRVTDRGGNFLTDEARAQNVAAGSQQRQQEANKKAYLAAAKASAEKKAKKKK